MGTVIVVTSGKGGVGKTTSTANLGLGLSKLNKKVCIIDGDFGLRNLDMLLGLENQVIYNILDIIDGRCSFEQAAIEDSRYPGLFFLASSQLTEQQAVDEKRIGNFIQGIKDNFDYILIDCPAGIEQGFKNAIAGANEAIIVTAPVLSSVRDADKIKSLLYKAGIKDSWVIINKYRQDLRDKGYIMSVNEIEEILGLKIIGIVPEDDNILRASNIGKPVVLDSATFASGMEYMNISKRIIGENIPVSVQTEKKGFFSKLFK